MTILLLYATPDTLHFQVRKDRVVAAGKYGRLGTAGAFFEIQRAGEEPYTESTGAIDHRAALRRLVEYLQRNQHILAIDDILAVIHRIPQGGRSFGTSVRLDHAAAARLEAMLRAHHALPAIAQVVRAALNQLPNAHHVGVVGSGIYQYLPDAHHTLATSPELRKSFAHAVGGEDGLWHEAAYQAALELVGAKRPLRAVSIHIEDQVTVTALRAGRALATTSGVGATASIPGLHSAGAVAPDTALSIAEALDTETWRVAELLAERSGLAGMTGRSSYAQIEVAARAGDAACIEALMLLAYRIAFVTAGMSAAIGAPELIVFSGDGASWTIIEETCRRLPGVNLRAGKAKPGAIVSAPGSRAAVVWVEHTLDEALVRLAAPHLPTGVGRVRRKTTSSQRREVPKHPKKRTRRRARVTITRKR